jgi:hypothetical protein
MDRVGDKRERSTESYHSKHEKSAAATEELDRYMSNVEVRGFSANVMVDLITSKGADPNYQRVSDGETPLQMLSVMGRDQMDGLLHDEVMKAFRVLIHIPNIDVTLVNKYGYMLIHTVVRMEDPAFLSMLLLENKASREHINSLDITGISALHIACGSSYISIQSIGELLDEGADPYLPSRAMGYAALFYAIKECGQAGALDRLNSILSIFIRHGVDIARSRGRRGENVMHMVVMYAYDAGICRRVLNIAGSRVLDDRDSSGKTPFQKARDLNRYDVVRVIEGFFMRTPRAG